MEPNKSVNEEMDISMMGGEPEQKLTWECPKQQPEQQPKAQFERKNKKLAIVGCSDSRNQAPFSETGWDYWGVNNLFLNMPDKPWTGWFEIHDIQQNKGRFIRRGKPDFRGQQVDKYLTGLAGLPCPVWMQKTWPGIPNSVKYPLDEILNRFGRYFTNTISWEIALALHLGYEKIGIWGVDMAVDTEYYYQRPSCEYMIGLAIGLGVDVIIPDEADLLKARFLYGFDEPKESKWEKKVKTQIDSMQSRRNKAFQQMELAKKQVEQYTGAIAAVNEQIKIWKGC